MPKAPTNLADGSRESAGVRVTFNTDAQSQPAWFVRAFTLTEGVSKLYHLQISLGAQGRTDRAPGLLGKNVTIQWDHAGEPQTAHGIVERVESGAVTERMTIVHLHVVPAMSVLAHTRCSRIFNDQTIPQVVEAVLVGALSGFLRTYRFDLAEQTYPRHEYIVQHREADLDFVQRMLAEQGLSYYFEHASDGQTEVLVIADSTARAPAVGDDPEVELTTEHEASGTREAITTFGRAESMRATSLRVRQFDWTRPDHPEDKEVSADEEAGFMLALEEHGDIASFDYRSPRYANHDTDAQAQMRLDAHRADRVVHQGAGNATCLRAGKYAKLGGQEYFLTHVKHAVDASSTGDTTSARARYTNKFECIVRDAPFRPARVAKPRMVGIQTAIVVDRQGGTVAPRASGDGDDIVTDVHGRVRVKFHWDTTTSGQGGTVSCWVRVAQSWAGAGWGTQFIPRVGMEVVVQYVDGDAEQPVITGCVYNGLNTPPYAHKPTQSGVKTASSVDPTRYNELRFEDAKGHEEIFVRSQRDYREEVMHDHTTHVHRNQIQQVTKNKTESIGGQQTLHVGGNRDKAVAGDESIAIKGERKVVVHGTNTEQYDAEHTVAVAKDVIERFDDTHKVSVTGTQTLELKSDKKEHISGTYELMTDRAFVLKQGGTTLSFEAGKVLLDAAGAVRLTRGTASIEIDAGGNISVKSSSAIALEVGPNKLTLTKDGISIEGTQVAMSAGPSQLALTPASATLSGVNTTIEAKAICSVKGAALLGLNS